MLRPELEALPRRMQSLKVDERGYPIPWFVDYDHAGKPEFRAMDPAKWKRALKEKLCWVCGERLGRLIVFVAGPMCGINRTSSEPANHRECAEWSVRNCPFLNDPHAVRRVDENVGGDGKCIGGVAITRNPGVSMLWVTDTYSLFPDMMGGYLIHMGAPLEVIWYTRGRMATREEVLASIESGFPALAEMAMKQEGAMKYLEEQREKFQRYLPAA